MLEWVVENHEVVRDIATPIATGPGSSMWNLQVAILAALWKRHGRAWRGYPDAAAAYGQRLGGVIVGGMR
jgi:hypothetical protein